MHKRDINRYRKSTSSNSCGWYEKKLCGSGYRKQRKAPKKKTVEQQKADTKSICNTKILCGKKSKTSDTLHARESYKLVPIATTSMWLPGADKIDVWKRKRKTEKIAKKKKKTDDQQERGEYRTSRHTQSSRNTTMQLGRKRKEEKKKDGEGM